MNPEFKRTMAYRHWMTCHDLAEQAPSEERELRKTVAQVLPPEETTHWDLVCARYDRGDLPKWFADLTERAE